MIDPTDLPTDPAREPTAGMDVGDYVIVRTEAAGVFAGTLQSRSGSEAVVADARRLWYWAGAASLSQLSMEGVSRPADCKFPREVPAVTLLGVIEVLPVTDVARKSIAKVPVWRA